MDTVDKYPFRQIVIMWKDVRDVPKMGLKERVQEVKSKGESTFSSAVIHHWTRCPHWDEAWLRVAASAIHCMEGKPENDKKVTVYYLWPTLQDHLKVFST